MKKVVIKYPSHGSSAERVLLWEALLLGGFVRSIKDAKLAIRSGVVHIDGSRVNDVSYTISKGTQYELSIKRPSGRMFKTNIQVVSKWRN